MLSSSLERFFRFADIGESGEAEAHGLAMMIFSLERFFKIAGIGESGEEAHSLLIAQL